MTHSLSLPFGPVKYIIANISAPLGALLTQDSMLCAGPSANRLVCDACAISLPWLEHACERCAIPLAQAGICGECLRRAPSFDAALAAFEYRFPLDRLIQRFKYSGDLAAGRWLALELAGRVARCERPTLLVAPPLARSRMRERGFNQAVVIAKGVAGRLGIRHAPGALAKVRDTSPSRVSAAGRASPTCAAPFAATRGSRASTSRSSTT